MRVTFLLPGYPTRPSGGALVVYRYAGALARKGHEVRVVHPRRLPDAMLPPAGAAARLRRRAAALSRWMRPGGPDWMTVDPRVELLFVGSLEPRTIPDGDVVVATWWTIAPLAAAFPQSRGRPLFLVQGDEVWGGATEAAVAAWRLPMQKVVVSRWLHELAVTRGVPESEVVHIPNAVDDDQFRVVREPATRGARVAFLLSSSPWKRSRDAVAALELARGEVSELEAHAFGVEQRPRWLPRWMRYTRQPTQVRLVTSIYNEAAIFLCSSSREGWYLPGAEALACGCAFVSTDCGGVRDYAEHGETALLSPPCDAAALARNVVLLLRDQTHRLELAERGNRRVRTLSWSESSSRFEEVLERVAAV